MNLNSVLRFSFATLPLGLLLSGCGHKGSSSAPGTDAASATTFRYPIVTNPTSYDPGKIQDGDTIDLVQQTFEGLVRWGEDNSVQPNLAEKWEISDGGKTYMFHLKKGVKFQNGREMTAVDFKWCFERVCEPAFASPTAETYLNNIVGVTERLRGKAKDISGISVVDPYTLQIKIDKPRPYFLGKLTYPTAFVYAKEALKDPSKEMNDVSELVGTGAFRIVKIIPSQVIELDANANYHGGAPKVAHIERPIVLDPATRLNMYKSGQIDLVQLERQDVVALQNDEKFKDQIKFFDRPAMWYVGLNCNIYPQFKDRRVRQAVAMAIDVDDIVNNILGGINKKATGIVPPGVFGHQDNPTVIKFNPEKAKQLLTEAGYPEGKGLPNFDLTYREARPDIGIVATKVASDLKKNLGMNVTLKTMEWRAYLDKYTAKKLPFYHMRWAADYLDAENFLSTLLASYGPENKVFYANPEYDALCQKADTSLDPGERQRLYAQAENIVLQDAPFVPIYFQRDAELISPRVKGLRESAFGHLPHLTVSVQ